MDDKKKTAALIIASMKPKMSAASSVDPEEDSGTEDMSDDEPDTMTAAKEVMMALKSNDTSGFADALKSFVKLCGYDKDDSSEGM